MTQDDRDGNGKSCDHSDFTVNLDGSPSPGPGSGNFVSPPQAGTVSFFGNDNASFTISTILGGCSGFTAGTLTLTEILLPPGPFTLDATLNIGGTINVPSNARGSGTCEYTLIANY